MFANAKVPSRNHHIVFIFLLTEMSQIVYSQNEHALENLFHRKCSEVSGEGSFSFQKLREDTYEMNKYFTSTFKDLPEKKNHFCNVERKNLDARIDIISQDLKSCLYGEEKFLSKFLRVSFREFLHFLCHNNGENIDTFFGPSGKDCRERMDKTNSTVEVVNCFSRIFPPLNGKITKKEMCDNVGVAKKCLATAVEFRCPNNGKMRELNEDFFRYIGTPCAGCNLYFSFVVLFLCKIALFIWK